MQCVLIRPLIVYTLLRVLCFVRMFEFKYGPLVRRGECNYDKTTLWKVRTHRYIVTELFSRINLSVSSCIMLKWEQNVSHEGIFHVFVKMIISRLYKRNNCTCIMILGKKIQTYDR